MIAVGTSLHLFGHKLGERLLHLTFTTASSGDSD